MMKGGPLFILGHGVIGQGQLCPPVRGCHALRCLVIIMSGYLLGLSRYRKNILRYFSTVLRYIVIYSFHHIFSKIQLIFQYSS